MYKYILESVNQINWLAIIPLLIFFIFFSVTIIRVMRKDKKYIDEMADLPLDQE